MKTAPLTLATVCLLAAPFLASAATGDEPFVFKTVDGQTTDAIRGSFQVPENRADPGSRMLTLRYVRFPATGSKPGAPIVYLAGGPGGSGIETAKRQRYPLFMAMRQFGDVIAFDQRGTGASDDTPPCEPKNAPSESKPLSDQAYTAAYRAAAVECAAFWKTKGIDLRGYNTEQSVQDLDALRQHLGADKISLWGISYGSHLALAALKKIDDRLDRVIIASVEGLDQTVKLPAGTDAYFDRLQAAVDTQPAAKAAYPDIKALLTRVHTRLEAKPELLILKGPDGKAADVLLQRRTLQMIASALISDPDSAVLLLASYRAADAGDFSPLANFVQRFLGPGEPMKLQAMPLAMDIASGIDDKMLGVVEKQAKIALLGDVLNFPMPQLRDALPELVLDANFRKPPVSHVPTLVLSGTLDGRTYPDAHHAAVAGLDHAQFISVVNAGHNLFLLSPEITATMERFMRGERLASPQITVPLPDFTAAPPMPPQAPTAPPKR